uniref:mRNA m(6)A methyltransferase n=1 Tax=Melopsittacus undulatus TaxID=13146 RepID=A0A8V5GFT8_MELUD
MGAGEPGDPGAAPRQHRQGTVHSGQVPVWAPSMGPYGSLWVSMDPYVSLCVSMGLYGFYGSLWGLWVSMCLCVSLCVPMGSLCVSMCLYVSLCVSMGLYGSLWVSMGLYVSLWVQVSQEILELLHASTAKEQSIVDKFQSGLHQWVPMDPYGSLLIPMGLYGFQWGLWGLWGSMGIYGSLLISMGLYGSLWGLWVPMGLYGSLWGLWVSMGLYGVYVSLCVSMCLYGSLWVSMGLYVSLWVQVSQEILELLHASTAKEQSIVSQEILELLHASTAKEQSIVDKFRSRGRAQVQEFCDYGTKEECVRASGGERACRRLHFRRIINKHTDESLGDCSFLNTCFHMDTCKYVHYEIDAGPTAAPHCPIAPAPRQRSPAPKEGGDGGVDRLFPPQWICCDIRYLDVSILGKFSVVMADPPWDIHMELPYGTLTDDEMRRLNIPVLQDEGFLFLWVTGRAMELGRECLNLWGYERVDEIIWVKTNQLQRIIRTGRTGHWLNHGKEHCLVGVKGNPQGFNRGLDCDVIVAEVRSTSHKPDEIYGMIERLSPGTRKIELFGRPHNVQPNWITLGNQLDGIHLLDPDVVAQFKQLYPDGVISKPKNL